MIFKLVIDIVHCVPINDKLDIRVDSSNKSCTLKGALVAARTTYTNDHGFSRSHARLREGKRENRDNILRQISQQMASGLNGPPTQNEKLLTAGPYPGD